jgi:2-C-methyl-D-erythritol 4-phosphate cytidylyltransferase
MRVWAVVPAAGEGRRMGAGEPKQYREAAGAPIFVHTLRALLESKVFDGITVAVAEGFLDLGRRLAAAHLGDGAPVSFVVGGGTRQESVYRALVSLEAVGVDIVAIHDAARPLVTADIIRRVVEAAEVRGAALAAVPATEASCLAAGGLIAEYIDRTRHMTIQTPQAFRYDLIMKAHKEAPAAGITDAVDDGLLILRIGGSVAVVEGDRGNMKVTYEGDLRMFNRV